MTNDRLEFKPGDVITVARRDGQVEELELVLANEAGLMAKKDETLVFMPWAFIGFIQKDLS